MRRGKGGDLVDEFPDTGKGFISRLLDAVVLRKVNGRFNPGEEVDHFAADRLDRFGEFSAQAIDGGGESRPGLCGDDVEDRLCLGKVETVVQEGAPCEFPRSAGRAPVWKTASSTVRRISGPPWQLISSVSSPV